MTTQEQLQAIRKQCIEVNPDIVHSHNLRTGEAINRPIRLADILLAININTAEQINFDLWPDGTLGIGNDSRGRCLYNLHQDDLTQQSPETIEFLYQLLYS